MTIYEIIFLAVILAIDAFIVSFSYGLIKLEKPVKSAFYLAAGTGFFQFLMPVLGALLTGIFIIWLNDFAKYLSGVIFILLGLKFIFEKYELNCKVNEKSDGQKELTTSILLLISLATSIDALAAGSSVYLLNNSLFFVLKASILIGVITFLLSLTGFYIGSVFKKFAPVLLGKAGGIILILLGLKIIFL